MRRFLSIFAIAAIGTLLIGCQSSSGGAEGSANPSTKGGAKGPVKIGFIVKSMSDSWFQNETKFAKDKAKELGVDIDCQEAKEGPKVLSTIDSMAANGCQGIIICAPDVRLGTAIVNACKTHNLKLMSVDDRLVGTDAKPLTDVPHLGIDAVNIGKQVGQAIADEMRKRGWKPEEVGGIQIITKNLETARQRVDGATEVLIGAGMKKDNFFEANWSNATDPKSASDAASAVLTAHNGFQKWVLFSSNDDGVLGGIRALDNRGIKPDSIIGVGINGGLAAQEWARGQQSGLAASILLQPKVHGGDTVAAMYKWITEGTEPQKETYTAGTVINKDNYKTELPKQGMDVP